MNSILKYIGIPLVIFSLQSCFVAKEYASPEVVENPTYRTDELPEDSVTLAEVSWREMFTDPLLVAHIDEGLTNNIDIRVALQQISIAQSYYRQGKMGQLPTLNANATVNHQQFSNNSQFGSLFDGGLTQYELSGTLAWEADIWGKIRSTKRAAEASYLQSVAAHKAVKTRLVANISSVYFQLLSLDEQLRIAEETVANRESSLETTRALKDAGTVTEVAVRQTEAQLHSARALVVDLKRNIKLLENTMSIMKGVAPEAIERSSFDEQSLAADELKTGYPVQLLRNRPDVIAAEYNLVNAFELTNVARSNFYPSLNISATGGFQSLELDELLSLNSLFANVAGSLFQPIINGRQIRTAYEVAESQEEIALLDFRQSILNAGREVSDAMYNIEAAEERITIKQEEFEAYDSAIGFSEELLNSGMANYLEVLTARQAALNAQLQLVNARYNRLNSVVELYRALGGGWD